LRKVIIHLFALFSQLCVTVVDVIAGDNIVAMHETLHAALVKAKKNLTGKTMHIVKIVDGKITGKSSKR